MGLEAYRLSRVYSPEGRFLAAVAAVLAVASCGDDFAVGITGGDGRLKRPGLAEPHVYRSDELDDLASDVDTIADMADEGPFHCGMDVRALVYVDPDRLLARGIDWLMDDAARAGWIVPSVVREVRNMLDRQRWLAPFRAQSGAHMPVPWVIPHRCGNAVEHITRGCQQAMLMPLLMAAELKTPSLLMVDVEMGQAFCGVGILQFTGCLVAPTRSGGIPDCTEVGRLLTAKQRDLVRNRNKLRSAVCPAFRREVRLKPVSDSMLAVTGQVSDFVYDPRFETKAVGLNRSTFPAALMLTGMMSSPTRGRKARRVRDIAEHAVIRALREMHDYADDMNSRFAVTGYAHR